MALNLLLRTALLLLWVLPAMLALPVSLLTGTPLTALYPAAVLVSTGLLGAYRAVRFVALRQHLALRPLPLPVQVRPRRR